MGKRFQYTPTGTQRIDDVGNQLQKIYNHTRQGSYATRARYAEAMERFIKIVVPEFHIQKLANISDKHLQYYVKCQKNNGCTDKYIKTDLSGIRFFHSQMDTKNKLSDSKTFNKTVGLSSTPDGRTDRAWRESEYREIREKAGSCINGTKIQGMLDCAKYTGTRLDEAATLRRGDIEKALRSGELHLKNTKGGRERSVPLTTAAKDVLREAIRDVKPGEYVYVPQGEAVHAWKAEVQNFLISARTGIQDIDRGQDQRGKLTYHGLRHFYARETYRELRSSGLSDRESRKILAERLGHGRIEITYVYVPK